MTENVFTRVKSLAMTTAARCQRESRQICQQRASSHLHYHSPEHLTKMLERNVVRPAL
jgi:hypothetical protein